MIFPVKIFNKHGELTNVITSEQLISEKRNAKRNGTHRERFNSMAHVKKSKTSKNIEGKRDATLKVKRPRSPIRSSRSRKVDDKECQEIDKQISCIINTIRNILGG